MSAHDLCGLTFGDENDGVTCQLPMGHLETEHSYRPHPDCLVTLHWPDWGRRNAVAQERAERARSAAAGAP